MKKSLQFVVSLFLLASGQVFGQAQLPDGSFELSSPSGWELVSGTVYQAGNITITGTKYLPVDGKNFMMLHTDTMAGKGKQVFPGIIATSVPYNDRPKYLKYFYSWLNASKTDSFELIFEFTRHDPSNPGNPVLVARNTMVKGGGRVPWAKYSEAINYLDAGNPDSVTVVISSGGKTDGTSKASITQGTNLLIDNIVFQNDDPNTGIDDRLPENNSISVYPNPFSQFATVHYSLDKSSYVKLVIQDITGKEVSVLQDGYETEGLHEAIFEASVLKPGLYFYRLQAGDSFSTGKIIKSL